MKFTSLFQVYEKGKTRKIADPLSPSFNSTQFKLAFSTENDNSPEDISAGVAGQLIGHRTKRIFSTLKELEKNCPRFSYQDIAIETARLLNKNYYTFRAEHINYLKSTDQTTYEAVRTRRSIKDDIGNSATLTTAMEALIDYSRNLLRVAHDNNGFGEKETVTGQTSIGKIVNLGIELGGALEIARRQWHMVIWYGAHAYASHSHPSRYAIDCRPSRLALLATLDLHRRNGHMERNFDELKELTPPPQRKLLTLEQQEDGISRVFTKRITELSSSMQNSSNHLLHGNESALDPSIKYFLENTSPKINGIPFKLVFEAWHCLSFLVIQKLEKIDNHNIQINEIAETEYSLSIEKHELIENLANALEIDTADSQKIIEFLTYKGHHQTLWTHPLLDIGKRVEILWFPTLGCHPMRLIHDWSRASKELGEAYGKKGNKYEEMVSLVTKSLHRHTNKIMPYTALGPRLKVSDKNQNGADVGDIDGAFVIENTIFIMECVTVQNPAEPFEFWLVQKELKNKIKQAITKKIFIEKNIGHIKKWQEKASGTIPQINRAVALIVSNSYLLEGEQNEEPYFIHLDTLFNILYKGRAEFGGGFDLKGNPITYHLDYLKNCSSAADAIINAIKHPIKKELALAAVKIIESRIPGFDNSEANGIILHPEIDAPDSPIEIKKLLQKCGFYQNLTEEYYNTHDSEKGLNKK